MKNRDRLVKFIDFLKKNPEVDDENIATRSIQEKITREGLGLRDSYTVSAMACLSQFVASFGGVEYFRTAPLEMVAGHRALALYVNHYLKGVTDTQGKCSYFKCSLTAAEKVYRKILKVNKDERVSNKKIRAMQHVLQSTNYYNDYFALKETPIDPTWRKEDFRDRVKRFIKQQVKFDKKKKEKITKKNAVIADDENDVEVDGQHRLATAEAVEQNVLDGGVQQVHQSPAAKRNDEESQIQKGKNHTNLHQSTATADQALKAAKAQKQKGRTPGERSREADQYLDLDHARKEDEEDQNREMEENPILLQQTEKAVDPTLSPALKKQRRAQGDGVQRAKTSPAKDRDREKARENHGHEEKDLPIQMQSQGRNNNETLPAVRKSSRKRKVPVKLNL